jgi:glycosyltransferase involved in cell wall biosynthesis
MAIDDRASASALSAPIALVMSRFPAVTETFILRELIELERGGVQVELAPLLRDRVSTLHPEAEEWDRRALYTPFLSGAIALQNLRVLLAAPGPYLGTLFTLLWDARGSLNALLGTLGIFPKSVYNGQRLRERGVRHVHAHYATHPASSAYIMKRVHLPEQRALPYSLTIHAHDIFVSGAGLERKLVAADFVRCISRFNVDYLLERFPQRLREEQFRVIHCGIEPERYLHRPAPGAPGDERSAVLLSIAAHRPYKGLTHLIEAVRRLRAADLDVRCDVIGEGYLRPQLEQQIAQAELGDAFRLLGTRTQEEVAEALSSCDLFVLPSIVAPDGQMEGIPVVLMEALAAGVPTISTRISGIPELVIDGKTGFLVEPAQPAALVTAVEHVLDDYAGAKRLAANGARLVREEFEIRENVRRLCEEFRAALSEGEKA